MLLCKYTAMVMPESYIWWSYLEKDQQNALLTSARLLKREKEERTLGIDDFSFVIFPAAKSYEGFLKKLFFDLGFISKKDYKGDRFRIGKALNPHLAGEFREESVYVKLSQFCKGKTLPDKLWETWKTSRNLVFHWWPEHKNSITIGEAEERLHNIMEAINAAFAKCKVGK